MSNFRITHANLHNKQKTKPGVIMTRVAQQQLELVDRLKARKIVR